MLPGAIFFFLFYLTLLEINHSLSLSQKKKKKTKKNSRGHNKLITLKCPRSFSTSGQGAAAHRCCLYFSSSLMHGRSSGFSYSSSSLELFSHAHKVCALPLLSVGLRSIVLGFSLLYLWIFLVSI